MSEPRYTDRNEGYYLPHHGLMKQTSLMTKLRMVFDASVRTTIRTSLNNSLMVGPVIQDDLVAILT